MTEAEMRQAFSALGYPAFRGSQVFKHLYEESHFPDGAALVFDTMTDLPKKMREEMTAWEETGKIDAHLPDVFSCMVSLSYIFSTSMPVT